MFLDEFNRYLGREPEPERKPIRSSKGYPEMRDPAADNARGILNDRLDNAALQKLRQRYAPSGPRL